MVCAGEGLRHDEDTDARGHEFDSGSRGGRAVHGPGVGTADPPVQASTSSRGRNSVSSARSATVTSSAAASSVITRNHDDRDFGVQRDGVEGVLVDRQPDEAGIGLCGQQRRGLGDLGGNQLQVHPGQPLGPGAAPFVHGDTGDDQQAERRGTAILGDGHITSEAAGAVVTHNPVRVPGSP